MKPIGRRFATRWKLLIGLGAAVPAGVTIALLTGTTEQQAAVAAPAATSSPAVPSATTPRSGCQVTYAATTWPGQFSAEVSVTNTSGTTMDGWELTFTFPGDQAISSAWNATFTQTGHSVVAGNRDYYDAAIQPGASRSLGFLGTWQSDDAAPTEFRLNGTVCS